MTQAAAGMGHTHNWRGRTQVGRTYTTDKPEPEEQRQLLAVGGERTPRDQRVSGMRVWSDKHQQSLPVDVEVLTWFARELAEARHAEEHGYDARQSGMGRDPQYLLDGPQTSAANIVCALNRAREAILSSRKVLDEPIPGLVP